MPPTMNSCMKHWKLVAVYGIFAWIFFFLMVSMYIMESRRGRGQLSSFSIKATGVTTHSEQGIALPNRDFNLRSAEENKEGHLSKEYRREGVTTQRHSPILLRSKTTDSEKPLESIRKGNAQKSAGEQDIQSKQQYRERSHFSRTRLLISNLWKGTVSAHLLSSRLQEVMKSYKNLNRHHVVYRGKRWGKLSGQRLHCELKRHVEVRTLDGSEAPFSGRRWKELVPQSPLDQLFEPKLGTCAVVASAGAILHSSLGTEIDNHDIVLRFNAAPTTPYERDVGTKTTIRIINSQIMASSTPWFNSSSLYKDVALVAWDPAPYAVNLKEWYEKPEYNLFDVYEKHRKSHPEQPFYILHPNFVWELWDIIQANADEDIQPDPPSSGFIGIILMMVLCKEVHVYEYIPSMRQTDLCHYYERYRDDACTLGAYHPLLYEKALIQRMNIGSDEDLRTKGKATLPGFSTIDCGP